RHRACTAFRGTTIPRTRHDVTTRHKTGEPETRSRTCNAPDPRVLCIRVEVGGRGRNWPIELVRYRIFDGR
ncbi:hypothetical protein, partial [Kitasatospora sp. NPDC090091]|uniref:hypothetical protein n=1 Tax=Kitasatospora sp. NPDC090091 TaxID=3364081 RepID=UPI00382F4105